MSAPPGPRHPAGRGAGTGKTIMALQSLVNAAREPAEPGVFVAFEEHSGRIREWRQQRRWEALGGAQ